MIDVTVPQYIDHQPFSVYYMTVSGHCMYSQKENAMARKNYDVVAGMDHCEAVKCYYASQQELEYAMESLVRQLEEAGIADDTVIVIATDHYPYGLERSGAWRNTSDYLAELYGVDSYDKFIRVHNCQWHIFVREFFQWYVFIREFCQWHVLIRNLAGTATCTLTGAFARALTRAFARALTRARAGASLTRARALTDTLARALTGTR